MIKYGSTGYSKGRKHIIIYTSIEAGTVVGTARCGLFVLEEGDPDLHVDFSKLKECSTCRKLIDKDND